MRTALSVFSLVSMLCTQIFSMELTKYIPDNTIDPVTFFNVSGEIIGIPTADLEKDDGLLNDLVFCNKNDSNNSLRDKSGCIILSVLRPVFEVLKCFLIYNDIPSNIDDFYLRQASKFFRNSKLTKLIESRWTKNTPKEYSIITRERMSPICPICNTKIESANNSGYACTTFLNHLVDNHCNSHEMIENQIISEQKIQGDTFVRISFIHVRK